jgi:hypothetical protein
LTTSVDVHNGDVTSSKHVLYLAVHPQRKYRRMLQHPNFVASPLIALLGKPLHRTPGGLVIDATEKAENGREGCRL